MPDNDEPIARRISIGCDQHSDRASVLSQLPDRHAPCPRNSRCMLSMPGCGRWNHRASVARFPLAKPTTCDTAYFGWTTGPAAEAALCLGLHRAAAGVICPAMSPPDPSPPANPARVRCSSPPLRRRSRGCGTTRFVMSDRQHAAPC